MYPENKRVLLFVKQEILDVVEFALAQQKLSTDFEKVYDSETDTFTLSVITFSLVDEESLTAILAVFNPDFVSVIPTQPKVAEQDFDVFKHLQTIDEKELYGFWAEGRRKGLYKISIPYSLPFGDQGFIPREAVDYLLRAKSVEELESMRSERFPWVKNYSLMYATGDKKLRKLQQLIRDFLFHKANT